MADASEFIENESDLSLSCQSSPFNEGDSDDEFMQEEEEGESVEASANNLGINPYQFEPYASDAEENSDDAHDQDTDERLTDSSCCTCGNCQLMPTVRECVCCHEVERVNTKREEKSEDVGCITLIPGFQTVCLDPDVLEVAYFQYRQEYGALPDASNERNRYTAYRQFVRWCWGYLGKEIRVIIPACAVKKIRSSFPDQDQNYTGFHYAAD